MILPLDGELDTFYKLKSDIIKSDPAWDICLLETPV